MRGIRVSKRYRSHARLLGHPGELRQVFSNLIANAIDCHAVGGNAFCIRIQQDNLCRVSVTIADTGHGIARDGVSRLGQLLFTTKGEAGTGLGLWVSYQIIEKHGGSVRVYSSTHPERSGSVFRLCFSEITSILNAHTDRETGTDAERFSIEKRDLDNGGRGDEKTA